LDNGLETVQRVEGDIEYVDPVEAKALVRAGLRRAWCGISAEGVVCDFTG
jgi:hypothetical protein